MVGAAVGGTIVAASVVMFIVVATGTYLANRPAEERPGFAFASVTEDRATTPAVLDHLARWGTIALVLAVLSYAGPIATQIHAHAYLAPGMKTW